MLVIFGGTGARTLRHNLLIAPALIVSRWRPSRPKVEWGDRAPNLLETNGRADRRHDAGPNGIERYAAVLYSGLAIGKTVNLLFRAIGEKRTIVPIRSTEQGGRNPGSFGLFIYSFRERPRYLTTTSHRMPNGGEKKYNNIHLLGHAEWRYRELNACTWNTVSIHPRTGC